MNGRNYAKLTEIYKYSFQTFAFRWHKFAIDLKEKCSNFMHQVSIKYRKF